MDHVDQNRLIKSYYIEQTYILQNRDPDSHVWWSHDREDTWDQLQDIIQFQKNSFGFDVYIKHYTGSREIFESLVSFFDHFKHKNFTKNELLISKLPMFTEVIIYSNWYDSETDWYVDPVDSQATIQDLYTKGMGYIEEIELISLVALVVR
jgi:hypothetical protein